MESNDESDGAASTSLSEQNLRCSLESFLDSACSTDGAPMDEGAQWNFLEAAPQPLPDDVLANLHEALQEASANYHYSSGAGTSSGLSAQKFADWGIELRGLVACLLRTMEVAGQEAVIPAAEAGDDEDDMSEVGTQRSSDTHGVPPKSKGRKAPLRGDASDQRLSQAASQASARGLRAASCYFAILVLPGCPALSLCNLLEMMGVSRAVKAGLRADVMSGATSAGAATSSTRQALSPWSVLQQLRGVVAAVALKEKEEVRRMVVELLVEALLFASYAAASSTRSKASAQSRTAVQAKMDCCLQILLKLMEPRHGDSRKTATQVMHQLAVNVLLPRGAKASLAEASVPAATELNRSAILDFVTSPNVRQTPHGAAAGAALARYLCLHTPDKADARAAGAGYVMKIVECMTESEQHAFHLFALKLSRNPKPGLRLMALEVGLALLSRGILPAAPAEAVGLSPPASATPGAQHPEAEEGAPDQGLPENEDGSPLCLGDDVRATPERSSSAMKSPATAGHPAGTPQIVTEQISGVGFFAAWLNVWKRRLGDSSPWVKCRAMATMAEAVRRGMLALSAAGSTIAPGEAAGVPGAGAQYLPAQHSEDPALAQGWGLVGAMLPAVRKAMWDEKCAVRKAACSALVEMLEVAGQRPQDEDIKAIAQLCEEPLVSVRKAGLTALSQLAALFPGASPVVEAWWEYALPLAVDSEATAQEQFQLIIQSEVLGSIGHLLAWNQRTDGARRGAADGQGGLCIPVEACLGMQCQQCPGMVAFCSGCSSCKAGAGTAGMAGAAGAAGTEAGQEDAPGAITAMTWLLALGRTSSGRTQSLLQRALGKVLDKPGAAAQGQGEASSGYTAGMPVRLARSLQAVIALGERKVEDFRAGVDAMALERDSGRSSAEGARTQELTRKLLRQQQKVWLTAVKGAWMMLQGLSVFCPAGISWEFLESRWSSGIGPASSGSSAGQASGFQVEALHVISRIAASFPADRASEIAREILGNLMKLSMSPAQIEAHLAALVTLSYQVESGSSQGPARQQGQTKDGSKARGHESSPAPAKARSSILEWSKDLLQAAKGVLQAHLRRTAGETPKPSQFSAAMSEVDVTRGFVPGSGSFPETSPFTPEAARRSPRVSAGSQCSASRVRRGGGPGTPQAHLVEAPAPSAQSVEAALFTVGQMGLLLSSLEESRRAEGEGEGGKEGPSAGGKRGRGSAWGKRESAQGVPDVLLHMLVEIGLSGSGLGATEKTNAVARGIEKSSLKRRRTSTAGLRAAADPSEDEPGEGDDQAGGENADPSPLAGSATPMGPHSTPSGIEKRQGGLAGSERVIAQAWLALGKLCLANQDHARLCIPIMVQELERSQMAAIRNNIVVVLADLCIRYTSLVDRYIPILAACTQDPSETVRCQTLALLVSLLQRDYLKWRGPVVFQLMLALADPAPPVHAIAKHVFTRVVPDKAPLLCYTHFIEALFWLNRTQPVRGLRRAGHEGAAKDGAPESLTSLRGPGCQRPVPKEQRMLIFCTLLENMWPEQRLALAGKLCVEVLAQVHEDGSLSLDNADHRDAVRDALEILGSKEVRPNAGAKASPGDVATSEEDAAAAAAASETAPSTGGRGGGRLRNKLVSHLTRHQLVEGTIPHMIELKRLLEKRRDPLQSPLMACLRALFADYSNEVEEILAADPQLAKELKYEIRKYEAQEARVAAATAAAAEAAASAGHTPSHLNASARKGTGELASAAGHAPSHLNPSARKCTGELASAAGHAPSPFNAATRQGQGGLGAATGDAPSHPKASTRQGKVGLASSHQAPKTDGATVPSPHQANQDKSAASEARGAVQEEGGGGGATKDIVGAEASSPKGQHAGAAGANVQKPRYALRERPNQNPLRSQGARRANNTGSVRTTRRSSENTGAKSGTSASSIETRRRGSENSNPGAMVWSPAPMARREGGGSAQKAVEGMGGAQILNFSTPIGLKSRGAAPAQPLNASILCSPRFQTPTPPRSSRVASARARSRFSFGPSQESDNSVGMDFPAGDEGEVLDGDSASTPEGAAAAAIAAAVVAAGVLQEAAAGAGPTPLGCLLVPKIKSSAGKPAEGTPGRALQDFAPRLTSTGTKLFE